MWRLIFCAEAMNAEEEKLKMCLAIANAELKIENKKKNLDSTRANASVLDGSNEEHGIDFDDSDRGLFSCNVAALVGLVTFMAQEESGKFGGILPKVDLFVRSKFLESFTTTCSSTVANNTLAFVHRRVHILAECPDSESPDVLELSELQYGLGVIAQLAHSCNTSRRKEVAQRKSDEQYEKLINDFFASLIDSVCNLESINQATSESQIQFRLKLLSLVKTLAVNKYLRVPFLNHLIESTIRLKSAILSRQSHHFLIVIGGFLVEAGVEVAHELGQELFPQDSSSLKDRISAKKMNQQPQSPGCLKFPALTFEMLKRHDKEELQLTLHNWIATLSFAVDELSLMQCAYTEAIYMLQAEIQAILDRINHRMPSTGFEPVGFL